MSLVYPETPPPVYSLVRKQKYRTNITRFRSGREQRQGVGSPFPLREVELSYGALEQDELDLLWNFYNQRLGQLYTFLWFHPFMRSVIGEYVSRGTGAATTFDLPSKSTVNDASLVVYVNNVITAVTFLSGGGDGGSDRIQFAAAPAQGATIKADFKGRHRLTCRFTKEELAEDLFEAELYRTGVGLTEVRW